VPRPRNGWLKPPRVLGAPATQYSCSALPSTRVTAAAVSPAGVIAFITHSACVLAPSAADTARRTMSGERRAPIGWSLRKRPELPVLQAPASPSPAKC